MSDCLEDQVASAYVLSSLCQLKTQFGHDKQRSSSTTSWMSEDMAVKRLNCGSWNVGAYLRRQPAFRRTWSRKGSVVGSFLVQHLRTPREPVLVRPVLMFSSLC